MGGKIWSPEEELVFWTKMIPKSVKALGIDAVKGEGIPWPVMADEMKHIMGNNARRDYTGLGLCEFKPPWMEIMGVRFVLTS